MPDPTTSDEFFAAAPALSRALFEAVRQAVEALGPCEVRVSKSQIAFRRRWTFAAVWLPERVLKRPAAPLVLTVFLRARDDSPRWKEVVEPYPGRFTHHLELHAAAELDAQVSAWLRQAWEAAG